MMKEWGLHWFRRDLRIAGNSALRENWKRTQGRTLGLFCFDSQFLSRPDFSHNRFAFFMESMRALKKEWSLQGGDLLVIDCLPEEAFSKIIDHCRRKKIPLPAIVTWNRDYEPFARARDSKIENLLKSESVNFQTFRDHLLFEPHECTKGKPEDFYQVYSPFGKKWFELLKTTVGQERILTQKKSMDYFQQKNFDPNLFSIQWKELESFGGFPFQDAFDEFVEKNSSNVTIPIPEAGFKAAYSQLLDFKSSLKDYKNQRDLPFLKGTSKLSMFLKNGSLVSTQIIHALGLQQMDWNGPEGPSQFTKELAWREFYYAILFHRPQVEKESFLPQYRDLPWENNKSHFERWKEGTTGFPIVDAGMRELRTTGWMHNRVRMIVASFLTKDLLIDWKWGENHFMKELLDGDLAPNNGGWQWAASTGCDPQPYFRVFNPWLQGAKFDPDGVYIKKYIPELKNAPAKAIHDPDSDRTVWKYPQPIVAHSVQRDKAIQMYKR